MRYLRGTEDLGLYYKKIGNPKITVFAYSEFKIDEIVEKLQMKYISLRDSASISWKSVKQTVFATSTNHA